MGRMTIYNVKGVTLSVQPTGNHYCTLQFLSCFCHFLFPTAGVFSEKALKTDGIAPKQNQNSTQTQLATS